MKVLKALIISLGIAALLSACSHREKIRDAREGRSSICEVHGVEMDTRIVPIDRGLPVILMETPYDVVEAKLFPHTTKHVVGGACFSDGTEKAQIYVCPQCEAAKHTWLDEMASETIERSKTSEKK